MNKLLMSLLSVALVIAQLLTASSGPARAQPSPETMADGQPALRLL